MRILSTTREKWLLRSTKDWEKVLFYDVVIVDGVVTKNRFGLAGAHVGGSIFGWDEEKVSESTLSPAMKG